MILKHQSKLENHELPLQLHISFEKVYSFFKKYAKDKNHSYYAPSKLMIEEIKNYPELIDGFSDYSLLDKYKQQIDLMLDPLFPEILQLNEIKVASIPFSFVSFRFTQRFSNILNNAGEDYEFNIRNMEENELYLNACVMILNFCYGYNVDFKRPYFFDIPDKKLGITKHYKVAFNADFADIIPTKNAPIITEEDYKLLFRQF